MPDAIDYTRPVISVWSSYGHTFMGMGEYADDANRDAYVSCLTCGAQFIERNLGDGNGAYETSNGDAPTQCSGRTDLSHGSEAVCEVDNGRACQANTETGDCTHVDFPCNCVQCMG
jgi:hypothetical protein